MKSCVTMGTPVTKCDVWHGTLRGPCYWKLSKLLCSGSQEANTLPPSPLPITHSRFTSQSYAKCIVQVSALRQIKLFSVLNFQLFVCPGWSLLGPLQAQSKPKGCKQISSKACIAFKKQNLKRQSKMDIYGHLRSFLGPQYWSRDCKHYKDHPFKKNNKNKGPS